MTLKSSLEAESIIASNENRFVLFPNYYKKYVQQLWNFIALVFVPFIIGYCFFLEFNIWSSFYRWTGSIAFSFLGFAIFFLRIRFQRPLSEKWIIIFEEHIEIWTLDGLEILLSKEEIQSNKISWGPVHDQPLPAIEITGKRIGQISIGINASNIYWPYFKKNIRATDYLIGDRFQWDNFLKALNIP